MSSPCDEGWGFLFHKTKKLRLDGGNRENHILVGWSLAKGLLWTARGGAEVANTDESFTPTAHRDRELETTAGGRLTVDAN